MRAPRSCTRLVLVFGLAFGTGIRPAAGQIQEDQLLLIFNSRNDVSREIMQYYIARHNVQTLDIDVQDQAGVIDQYRVTPQAFYDEIVVDVRTHLNDPANAGILAFATTRGIPAVITNHFNSAPTDAVSVEQALARVGYIDSAADVTESTKNPYYETIGVPWADVVTEGCPRFGNIDYPGKIFAVSRLDSSIPDFDHDGDYDDYDGIDVANPNHLDGVKAMIDRAMDLRVRKSRVILVYDDKPVPCFNIGPDVDHSEVMCDAGWCRYVDTTEAFLNSPFHPLSQQCNCGSDNCPGECDPLGGGDCCPCAEIAFDVEQDYSAFKELVHVTQGRNSVPDHDCENVRCYDCDPAGPNPERVCKDYIRYYAPHAAGLFMSAESFNGKRIFDGVTNHGNVLEWIGAGGSFTYGNLEEPGSAMPIWPAILNLYEHGLTWGESFLSAVPVLGGRQSPIGDPLATVFVLKIQLPGDPTCPTPNCGSVPAVDDPACLAAIGRWDCRGDLNGDLNVDDADEDLMQDMLGCDCIEGDYTGDGTVTQEDLDIFDQLRADYPSVGDFDGNGVLNCADYLTMVNATSYDPDLDLDCDGVVGSGDDLIFFWYRRADFNGDGVVDCNEIQLIENNMCTLFCPLGADVYDMDCDFDVDGGDVELSDFARCSVTGCPGGECFVFTPACGDPAAGSCFEAHPWANCDDAACCDLVITIASQCSFIWDAGCADLAAMLCTP